MRKRKEQFSWHHENKQVKAEYFTHKHYYVERGKKDKKET
jgi:hypothetical protein